MGILLLIIFIAIFLFSLRDRSKRLKELQDTKQKLQNTKQKLQNVNNQIEANNKRIQELKSN